MGDEGDNQFTGNGGYARRIERLERQYDTLSGTVNSMAVDVAVTREKIASVDSGIGDLKTQVSLMGAQVSAIALKMAYAAGAIAILVVVLNIFSAPIQKALGLPS